MAQTWRLSDLPEKGEAVGRYIETHATTPKEISAAGGHDFGDGVQCRSCGVLGNTRYAMLGCPGPAKAERPRNLVIAGPPGAAIDPLPYTGSKSHEETVARLGALDAYAKAVIGVDKGDPCGDKTVMIRHAGRIEYFGPPPFPSDEQRARSRAEKLLGTNFTRAAPDAAVISHLCDEIERVRETASKRLHNNAILCGDIAGKELRNQALHTENDRLNEQCEALARQLRSREINQEAAKTRPLFRWGRPV